MAQAEIKKQISIFLPITDWRALRLEAARQEVPITELCRRWIIPEIGKLTQSSSPGDRRN
ncbi:hypothetical protein SH661x_003054 [Planctomicrobium sp. SH661]|uniref:hypothetical protein n=1 Tax=Planctomicrobium sp. SH661 TaxID=3448124 RepID=UPI003F5C2FDD